MFEPQQKICQRIHRVSARLRTAPVARTPVQPHLEFVDPSGAQDEAVARWLTGENPVRLNGKAGEQLARALVVAPQGLCDRTEKDRSVARLACTEHRFESRHHPCPSAFWRT